MAGYLQAFRWDGAKFNVNTNLSELAKDVLTKVSEIDHEMKKKMQTYGKIKTQHNSIERSNQCVTVNTRPSLTLDTTRIRVRALSCAPLPPWLLSRCTHPCCLNVLDS
jgi:hypothetical protein